MEIKDAKDLKKKLAEFCDAVENYLDNMEMDEADKKAEKEKE
jgi:hypothetical protein